MIKQIYQEWKERHGRLAEGSVIMHVTKYTRGTLGHMLGHYDRTKDGLGENVVPERTQLNYNLAVDDQPLKQLDFVHKRLGEVRCLKRKDVNVLCDWVVTMPKDLVPISNGFLVFASSKIQLSPSQCLRALTLGPLKVSLVSFMFCII